MNLRRRPAILTTDLYLALALGRSCGAPRFQTDKGAHASQAELTNQIYERLTEINQNFEKTLANMEILRKMDLFRQGPNGSLLKSCRHEIREACARINFEIMGVLVEDLPGSRANRKASKKRSGCSKRL
jgi:hypothetical protein